MNNGAKYSVFIKKIYNLITFITSFYLFYFGNNNIKGSDKIINFVKKISKTKIVYLSFYIVLCGLMIFGFLSTKTVNASKPNSYVCLGGDSIGLNLNTNVYVTGKYEIKTNDGLYKPWENSNIEVGDIIYYIDNVKINSIDNLKESNLKEGRHVIKLYRNNDIIETSIELKKDTNNSYPLGLYVKDNVLGVGTMTYFDLKTKKFASLGHQAVSGSIRKGILSKSYVSGITKGVRGIPGEKKAYLDRQELGVITENNVFGVFGNLTKPISNCDLVKLGTKEDAHTGKAYITTVLSGDKKEQFEVNIIEVKDQLNPDIKGIKFEVTDKVLLDKTGGIIQGMSGSPIVQDGSLIGAVSHVLVDDCKIGYGVFVEFMASYT